MEQHPKFTTHGKRKSPPTQIVVHITAGPYNKPVPKIVAQHNAAKIKLGYHTMFSWSTSGEVTKWECADPATDIVQHARGVNAHTVGVAMVWPGPSDKYWSADANALRVGYQRIHGRQQRWLEIPFGLAHACVQYVYKLAQDLDISTACPPETWDTVLPPDMLAKYGVVGHYHLQRNRTDPGSDWMRVYRDYVALNEQAETRD